MHPRTRPADAIERARCRRGNIGVAPVQAAEGDVGDTDVGERQKLGFAVVGVEDGDPALDHRSEEHTSELQSIMRISYDVFCLKKKQYEQSIIKHLNYTEQR